MTTQHSNPQPRTGFQQADAELPAAPPARRRPKRESVPDTAQQPAGKEIPMAAFVAGGTAAAVVLAAITYFTLRSPRLETIKGGIENRPVAPIPQVQTEVVVKNIPQSEPVRQAPLDNERPPKKLPPVEVYHVTGNVKFNGEPAPGAFVVFHPLGDQLPRHARPSAQVRQDGSFTLSTFSSQDGAPAAEYAVTIQWRRSVENSAGESTSKNVLPKRYLRPETSGLLVHVVAGENIVPTFDLHD